MDEYFNSNIDLNDITPPEVSHTVEKVEKKIEIPTPVGGEIYTDAQEKKVPIPEGFKYKEGIEHTGLVIIDNANENEFVWVPVPYVVAENGNIEEKTKDVIIIDAKDKESKIKSIENITTENIIKISETKYEVTENGVYI